MFPVTEWSYTVAGGVILEIQVVPYFTKISLSLYTSII